MYCPKCGSVVSKNAFFCQWCGEKIDLVELDSIAERIKYIRKQTIEKNTSDLEICKYVSKIYRDRSYLQSYDSFEAFGQNVLDIEKSDLFMYKNVGEKLLNADGEPLIKHGFDWGIGKLNELYTLDVDVINMLIDDNFIRPSMSLAQLRECVKKIKNALLNR